MAIRFDPATHTYWIGDRQLMAVTSLVAELTPEFDRDGIAAKTAAKRGTTAAALVEEWEASGQKARDKGDLVHAYIEDQLSPEPGLFLAPPDLPEVRAFHKAWDYLRVQCGCQVVAREVMLGCGVLGVAGRADLVLDGNGPTPAAPRVRRVTDWKTGKYQTANRYGTMLPPFHDLPDCQHSKASIQTSLYRLLGERSDPPVRIDGGMVVHLKDDGTYLIYRPADLRERLLAWLATRGKP